MRLEDKLATLEYYGELKFQMLYQKYSRKLTNIDWLSTSDK